jgi:alkylation response protein AidB-like acyl-CoA dehydrogenase
MATTAVGLSLLEAVKEIAPVIRENAARSERDRRLTGETVEAMKRAGVFRMCKPRAFGGMEVDAMTAMRVYEEISRIDVSAGWNLIISSAGANFGSWIPEEGLEEFLAGDPDRIVAGAVFPPGKAVPVDGGYRVTGRWPFASGCQHASWFIGPAHVSEGEGFAVMKMAGRFSCYLYCRQRRPRSSIPGTPWECVEPGATMSRPRICSCPRIAWAWLLLSKSFRRLSTVRCIV